MAPGAQLKVAVWLVPVSVPLMLQSAWIGGLASSATVAVLDVCDTILSCGDVTAAPPRVTEVVCTATLGLSGLCAVPAGGDAD